jgi:diguanylate cyclase (GGDEF)-like protein
LTSRKNQYSDYYHQSKELSKELSKDKFRDIDLSSQLELITVCDQDKQDIGIKLERLHLLLQSYAGGNDLKSLAHIYNNIGLFYASIGQRALAAEQYEKTYLLGLDVYQEKNQLTSLYSLITAYTGSGENETAKLMVAELGERNLKINTPLTNSWYHFAERRQAIRTHNDESLRKSLRSWHVFLKQTSNNTMQLLYEWYVIKLCLYEEDKACVINFLQKQNDTKSSMPASLSEHLHYIGFLVKANLFLGDVEAAQQSFDSCTSLALEKLKKQQESVRVLGVANLHNEIINLETSLVEAEEQRSQIILIVLISFLGLVFLAYLIWGRVYLRKLTTEPLSGLFNEHFVVVKIKKVKAPIDKKVNAFVLLDLINFAAVNASHSYKEGELILKQIAECLMHVSIDKDIVVRIDAEQFIVFLVNIEDTVAKKLFGRIKKVLADERFNNTSGKKVDVLHNVYVHSSVTSLSDIDEVLAEIRSVFHKT